MNVPDYEAVVRQTNNYGTSREDFLAMSVALAGEVGEYCNKAKKLMYVPKIAHADDTALLDLRDELGDVLYYATDLLHLLGGTLNEALQQNADKVLARRAARTTYNYPMSDEG
jgi:NTP pyrophosphatase (non-canonical NTP hydrolase)